MEQKKLNLNEVAYQSLKEMILNGELKPGEKLKEVKLAKLLQTSRTPIRDAIRRLDQENLVKVYPSQGAHVTMLSKKIITNLYNCRAVLEGLAVRESIQNISKEDLLFIDESIYLARKYYSENDMKKTLEKNTIFHDVLIESSKNLPLIQMMENIRTQILRYRTITSFVGFRENFINEHFEIYQAVSNKESEKAELLMKRHILHDLEHMLEKLEDNRYFNS
ncbi:GntR family transcriptional regulator [Bacillus sp. JJ1566]|uniref:GntR family transcriptional regulator n=1 Tax=Bacillus sp. JJ1566 TaxID=3122961 RepID=UPI002FFF5F64